VHQWKLRTSGTYLRDALFKRDQGVCAQCGADTESMKIALRLARRESPERYHAVRETFRLTEAEALKSLWHADHIVEVADGGGACGLENLQILCWKCHKAKTADQRRARAALRRGKGS
jgi:5-methylcytosine-specific restriction endonuclease McrA